MTTAAFCPFVPRLDHKSKGRTWAEVTDPFAKREPLIGGSFRESSLELAEGAVVNELGDGDTIPAELLAFLEKPKS